MPPASKTLENLLLTIIINFDNLSKNILTSGVEEWHINCNRPNLTNYTFSVEHLNCFNNRNSHLTEEENV